VWHSYLQPSRRLDVCRRVSAAPHEASVLVSRAPCVRTKRNLVEAAVGSTAVHVRGSWQTDLRSWEHGWTATLTDQSRQHEKKSALRPSDAAWPIGKSEYLA
jgi:hypothetical protein